MKPTSLIFAVIALVSSWGYAAFGGTVSGTVKDQSGAPFKGAFVRARKLKSNVTVNVLSDKQGRYQLRDLQ